MVLVSFRKLGEQGAKPLRTTVKSSVLEEVEEL